MASGGPIPGGEKEGLERIQREAYGEFARALFSEAKEDYDGGFRCLDSGDSLWRLVEGIEAPDHRVIQFVHDVIAGCFRPSGEMDEQGLAGEWSRFFHEEIRQLVTPDGVGVALSILMAVAYQGTDAGAAAETELRELLRERYGDAAATAGTVHGVRRAGKRRRRLWEKKAPDSPCHLTQQTQFSSREEVTFEVVERFLESSHLDILLFRCTRCGHLYLYCFVEVCRPNGEDDMWSFYVPIEASEVAAIREEPRRALEVVQAVRPHITWHPDGPIRWTTGPEIAIAFGMF